MNYKLIFILLIVLISLSNGNTFQVEKFNGGGATCTVCTLGMRVLQQIASKEGSIRRAVEVVCDLFPKEFNLPCKMFFTVFAGIIIREFERGANPDRVCQVLRLCTDPTCALFKPKGLQDLKDLPKLPTIPKELEFLYNSEKSEEWWRRLLNLIGLGRLIDVFETHMPFSDADRDRFATSFGLRGTAWRGKDCSDRNKDFYPGRKVGNSLEDYNCNGISGRGQNGKPYKEDLCSIEQRGVILVGDSACAHFRIPEQYINVTNLSLDTYKHLYGLLEREADWPHLSWGTGHRSDHTGDTPGQVDSIYMKLKEINRCNHRDYQNVCVNGARSGAIANKLIKTIHRNQTHDHPVILFYAPIGNDICTPRPEGRGTDPREFYENTIKSLDHLNKTLPLGSYVVFIGIVDGRILWNTLHNEMHPIGAKYRDVYHHLSCLRINPCWLWMNTNETWREFGSRKAEELNQVYPRIIRERQHLYPFFKMQYQSFPMPEMIEEAKKLNIPVKNLIEPFDGFHPSQLAQNLQAKIVWEKLIKEYPDAGGKRNPNNDYIKRLFGEQGGY